MNATANPCTGVVEPASLLPSSAIIYFPQAATRMDCERWLLARNQPIHESALRWASQHARFVYWTGILEVLRERGLAA